MGEAVAFTDTLKNFLSDQFNNINKPLTLSRIGLTLFMTLVIASFIYFVYKKTFNGVLYTRSFNVSLVMISMVTSMVMMPVSSNVVQSLKMVGALSIIRFRAAVKDPMDIGFLFWAISVGIAAGTGFYFLALIGSLFIGLVLFIFSINVFKVTDPFLLIVHHDTTITSNDIQKALPKHRLRSKSVTRQGIELTVEMRVRNNDTSFLNEILGMAGVKDAVLVSYNGDYVS